MAEGPDDMNRDHTHDEAAGAVRDHGERESREPAGSDRIRADIDRTRAQMDQTVDELQSRMSLESLTKSGLEMLRDGAGTAARTVGQVIKDHPISSAVIAAGFIWMIAEKRRAKLKDDRSLVDEDDSENVGGEQGATYMPSASRATRPKGKSSDIRSHAAKAAHPAAKRLQAVGRSIKGGVQDASGKV